VTVSARLSALATLLGALLLAGAAGAQRLTLWHAYRGAEQTALDQLLARWRAEHPGASLEVLALPFEAYASKLEAAIPRGNGPDLFVDAHERLASYRGRGLVAPYTDAGEAFDETARTAFTADGRLYGLPLAVKCVALYVNPALVPDAATADTLESIAGLRASMPAGAYPLVYEAASAYFHAPLLHAYGGALLDEAGRYAFVGPAAERSLVRVMALLRDRVVPEETSGALVSQLFVTGRAATAISGPWLAAELGDRVRYRVQPLPRVMDAGGRPMQPYATVEGVMLSARAHDPAAAQRLAAFLTSPESSVVRARVGRQVVATRAAWTLDPDLARDPLLATFRAAAAGARPMPTHPNMRAAWEPARQSMLKALRGDRTPAAALAEGARRFADVTRPLPPRRDATWALLALGALALGVTLSALRRAGDPEFRTALRRSMPAYAWLAHAAVVVTALVVVPLVLGAATSLYATREGTSYYVGLANYVDILTARGGPLLASGSFYRVLLVTVLWTAVNLALHVSAGVGLALLLSRPLLRMRALYRVLLIVPWAVPSYVTALAWRGMFHRQFGAVNAVITALGGEAVSWFARFSTAFAANVATNLWLGFPFMMVVTIGALAAIPRDLYEAASVDGATPWQQFWKITVPLLVPSLGPSVALGAVWTFNQFNVVFLVSGGEPDGSTDILVSEAYRWAFTRQAQYGYAAAYAVLIFAILALVNAWRARSSPEAAR
jgi:arabinogalactan oligomer/maltooligosaccharide transport system permease protein